MYEGADDSIPTSMDSMEACCSLENCCVDSDDLAKLAAAATSTEEEEEEEDGRHDGHPELDDEDNDVRAAAAVQEVTENCCYDLDASLDSADVQLSSSHEEQTIESHLRIRRRKQKQQQQQMNNDCRRVVAETGKAFIPFSEETMFCDSNDMAPPHTVSQSQGQTDGNVDTSSPVSSDSWMNYSSHSSDDYSFIMESTGHGSVGSSAEGGVGVSELRRRSESMDSASIVPKNKRNRDSFKFRKEQSIDEGDSQTGHSASAQEDASCDRVPDEEEGDDESVDETLAHLQINQPKRLRGKEPEAGAGNVTSGSGRSGGKSVNSSRRSSTNSPQQLVDIRIIDFAHTAFAKRNSNDGGAMMPPQVKAESGTTAIHKGPDCGFLTGVDSLKRLLQEILPGIGANGEVANTSNLIMIE